jgi:hypothetical protein
MSKAKKNQTDRQKANPLQDMDDLNVHGLEKATTEEDVSAVVRAVVQLSDMDAEWPELPPSMQDSIDRASQFHADAAVEGLDHIALSEDDKQWVRNCVLGACEQGFVLAVYRYAKHLHSSTEAMSFINARTAGIDKGHDTQAKRARELKQRIREKWAAMEAAGEKVTNDTVAAAIRADGVQCSRSTVIRAFKEKPSSTPPKRMPRRRR